MGSETLAVFGGSFNPPHVAHTLACLWVLETQPVSRLAVVPTFRHAFEKALAPFDDRLEMCRLAMAPLGERVFVDDVERDLDTGDGKPSLTLTTLEALAKRHPGVQLRLVIGSDILPERDKWWRWGDIEKLAPPIVVARAGYPLPEGLGPMPAIPQVSSTEIRAHYAAGREAGSLVSRRVGAYIMQRNLYR
jgi:nicotinate-nucleotide adenylyltransferase